MRTYHKQTCFTHFGFSVFEMREFNANFDSQFEVKLELKFLVWFWLLAERIITRKFALFSFVIFVCFINTFYKYELNNSAVTTSIQYNLLSYFSSCCTNNVIFKLNTLYYNVSISIKLIAWANYSTILLWLALKV